MKTNKYTYVQIKPSDSEQQIIQKCIDTIDQIPLERQLPLWEIMENKKMPLDMKIFSINNWIKRLNKGFVFR